jgi:Flp pilus assembly protein TadG
MICSIGSIQKIYSRARLSAAGLLKDRSGIAATEFAVIVPLMLVMFFGVVEFSSALAIDRKITIMARTLADLTSQAAKVNDTDLAIYFGAAGKIMQPYIPPIYPTPNTTVSELYIDPASGDVRVQWSKGSAPRSVSSIVTAIVPTSLISRDPVTNAILPNQYLIFSEVDFTYVPAVGYVMVKTGVKMSDVAYTRPRQSMCVFYPTTPAGNPPPCPTL